MTNIKWYATLLIIFCLQTSYWSQYSFPTFIEYQFEEVSWEPKEGMKQTITFWEDGGVKTQISIINDSLFSREDFFQNGRKKLVLQFYQIPVSDSIEVSNLETDEVETVVVNSIKIIKHGIYGEYFNTVENNLKCKGSYVENLKDGEWTKSLANGQSFQANYSEDHLIGDYIEFYAPNSEKKKIIKTKGKYSIKKALRKNKNLVTGEMEESTIYNSVPSGNWLYFNSDGSFLNMLSWN